MFFSPLAQESALVESLLPTMTRNVLSLGYGLQWPMWGDTFYPREGVKWKQSSGVLSGLKLLHLFVPPISTFCSLLSNEDNLFMRVWWNRDTRESRFSGEDGANCSSRVGCNGLPHAPIYARNSMVHSLAQQRTGVEMLPVYHLQVVFTTPDRQQGLDLLGRMDNSTGGLQSSRQFYFQAQQ